MKIFSRNFTRIEKILILVLAIVLVGLVYYKFVYVNIEETISSANAEAETLQGEVDIAEAQLAAMQAKQSELDSIEASDDLSYMPSYNSSSAEIAFLNDVLDDTLQYSISFADVTRSGDQIRRNFTLQYRTKNYADAEKIIQALCDGEFRCLVGDIQCSIADDGTVTIGQTATFYETMVGGVPDSGLPVDSAAQAEPSVEG